jgi:hypothetical protein
VTKTFTLTSGVLNTTNNAPEGGTASLVTINAAVAPPAGSATSYVNGPLQIKNNTASGSKTFAVGRAGAFRPVTLKQLTSSTTAYGVEVIAGPISGTPQSPLVGLSTTRCWRITGPVPTTARVNVTFGPDDNVGSLATLRVSQSLSQNGTYADLGGTTTGSPSAGTVESTVNLTASKQFYALGSTQALPVTWDGGAGTTNWGDANNWNPNGVPTASTTVTLSPPQAATIDVNGAFAVSTLTVGSNVTLNLGSGSLSSAGTYSQSGGTVNLGSGSLTASGATTITGGTLNSNAGAFNANGAFTLSGGAVAVAAAGRIIVAGN